MFNEVGPISRVIIHSVRPHCLYCLKYPNVRNLVLVHRIVRSLVLVHRIYVLCARRGEPEYGVIHEEGKRIQTHISFLVIENDPTNNNA